MSTIEQIDFPLVESIVIPMREFDRWGDHAVYDGHLKQSIQNRGIEQPVHLLRVGMELWLVDGSKRLGAAKELKMTKIPAIIHEREESVTPIQDAAILRTDLNIFDDPCPTVEAELLETHLKRPNITKKELAEARGTTVDSIDNRLAVRNYIKPVQDAMDRGELTMQNARIFRGMSDLGQHSIWKKHGQDLCEAKQGEWHDRLRKMYPPQDYPNYYVDPKGLEKKLATSSRGKKRNVKPPAVRSEKFKLLRARTKKTDEKSQLIAAVSHLSDRLIIGKQEAKKILRDEAMRALFDAHDRSWEMERGLEEA